MSKRTDFTLERTINLTGDEYESLRAVFNMEDAAKRFVAALVEEFLERQLDRERKQWDWVAQKCGFNSHDELQAARRHVQLDFATRQIKLSKKAGAQ